jgi:predicted nuclease of predicted toxin-antitoxin system
MRIYLDDNIADPRFAAYLAKQGHEVTSPVDVGNEGITDARHLAYAITNSLVMLTRDVDDFDDLHELIVTAGGTHPGILLVHASDDPTRNLTPRGIATAIAKLEAAGVSVAHRIHALNHWR